MLTNGRESQKYREEDETVALQALAFMLGEDHWRDRFLALTGTEPERLRQAIGEPDFLAGVLQFLLDDESLLLAFATAAGLAPERIAAVRQRLARDHAD